MTACSTAFCNALAAVIRKNGITRVLETGTYDGRGSTKAMAEALKETGGFLHTIESNANLIIQARLNLKDLPVEVHHGCSLTPPQLPKVSTIIARMREAQRRGLYVDNLSQFGEGVALQKYLDETKSHGHSGLLGTLVDKLQPELVLLDSAGCCGPEEYDVLMSWLWVVPSRTSFLLALDDINHVKHFETWGRIQQLKPNILFQTEEKFGSAIVEVN